MLGKIWKRLYESGIIIIDLLAIVSLVIINGLALIPAILLGQKLYAWTDSIWIFGLLVPVCYFVYLFTYVIVNGIFKRIFIGQLKVGNYAPTSPQAVHWLRGMLFSVTHENFLFANIKSFNIFRRLHFWIMGSKIHKRAGVAIKGNVYEPELTTIGQWTAMGMDAFLSGHVRSRTDLIVGPVKVGQYCLIGARSVILPHASIADEVTIGAGCVVGINAKIEKGAVLLSNSALPANKTIPANEVWGGVPAQPITTGNQAHEKQPV
jgi:carbonic anhydrase/acetyltransferase-like protein (isoleucine patch superfamily)